MLIPKTPSNDQIAFARAWVATGDYDLACASAGIAPTNKYMFLALAGVRTAIREAQGLMLETELRPKAWRVINQVLDAAEKAEGVLNRQQSDMVRFVAGQGAALNLVDKTQIEGRAGSEMTREELLAFARRSQAIVDKFKQASGDAAKTIDATPQAIDNTSE